MPLEVGRGTAAEATLWGVIARLRNRGWHISLREIQRAQDVVAFLFATLGRPPSDDELRRYLRPIFCARDGELQAFAEVFQESLSASTSESDDGPGAVTRSWRKRMRLLLVAAFVMACAVVGYVRTTDLGGSAGDGGSTGSATGTDSGWPLWVWSGLLLFIAIGAGAALLSLRKQLRRRPGSPSPGPAVVLGWEAVHPLDPADCAQVARVLRTRIREPGRSTLDVPRTVDASIRAGIRLTPRFVEYKRAPEYLAVIEQYSAGDVLAGYYARVVDQLAAQGVAMSRVGLQARSQLVLDPARGPRHLDTLQPTSERERLLLFAPNRSLRDPLTGAERPWLTRFDRWAETIQIDPNARHARRLGAVHRVLNDVRALDSAWARERIRPQAAGLGLPTIFEEGDQIWIEVIPPPRDDLVCAMDLLVTALGPAGWYWLGACAVYPEISYELTVALGRLVHADDGRPLADHLPLETLARLPWFRHAYMPDWLRASLIVTLSRGQLGAIRAAVHQILTSGLLAKAGSRTELSVTEAGPRPGQDQATTDRVYLDGTALRRRRLAAAAPKQLVEAIRRQRRRFATTALPADAPAPRVRRALVVSNGLLVATKVVSTVGILVLVGQTIDSFDPDTLKTHWYESGLWPSVVTFSMLTSFMAAVFSCAASAAAGRRRGLVLGAGLSIPPIVALSLLADYETHRNVVTAVLVLEPVLAWAWMLPMLYRNFTSKTTLWATFQRRNRAMFAVGLLVTFLAAFAVDPVAHSGLEMCLACVALAGSAVVLGSAYVGGVPVVPVAVGGVFMFATLFDMFNNGMPESLLLAASAVVVLIGFALRLRRFRQHPPLEFWETRWGRWRGTLAAVTPAVVSTVAFVLFGNDVELVVWCGSIATAVAAVFLLSERVSAFAARHRIDVRSPLHLD